MTFKRSDRGVLFPKTQKRKETPISWAGWISGQWVQVSCQQKASVSSIISYSHRSCNISLFCFFHCSLKSVENSCQMEKKVLGETSFSPALGLTEKDTLNSKKLRTENKNITLPKTKLLHHEIRETHTDCCETRPCWANMQNMKVNLEIICLFFTDLMAE